jgi:hypothetical protein
MPHEMLEKFELLRLQIDSVTASRDASLQQIDL